MVDYDSFISGAMGIATVGLTVAVVAPLIKGLSKGKSKVKSCKWF